VPDYPDDIDDMPTLTRERSMPQLRLEIYDGKGRKRVLTKHAAIERLIMRLKEKRAGSQSFQGSRNGRGHVLVHSDGPASKQSAAAAEYVRSLKEAEGGAWSSQEFSERADITRQALQERREAFSMVYWTDAKGHCHYPKWQFDSNLQVHPHVREILGILHTHDTLRVLTTFLVPSIGEPGVSPLQLIQAGKGPKAVSQVRAIANEH
jgi:hypothetical protein